MLWKLTHWNMKTRLYCGSPCESPVSRGPIHATSAGERCAFLPIKLWDSSIKKRRCQNSKQCWSMWSWAIKSPANQFNGIKLRFDGIQRNWTTFCVFVCVCAKYCIISIALFTGVFFLQCIYIYSAFQTKNVTPTQSLVWIGPFNRTPVVWITAYL